MIGILVTMQAEWSLFGTNPSGFWGNIVADQFSIIFEMLYLLIGLFTICISIHYIHQNKMNFGEYYFLLLTSIIGMMLMSSSLDLLTLFIGIEIMSISSYIMVGMLRHVVQSAEASLKYLLLGAFSTGFLLYGISMLYGATGSIQIPTIASELRNAEAMSNPLVLSGIILLFIGLGFKIAVFPFHMWTPDVYTGAPTPVTGFMSAAVKAAGFAVLVRVFLTGFPIQEERWSDILWIITVFTMTVGNLMALQQENLKRMLAFSSVAHAGYVMIAIVIGSSEAISAVVFYSFVYSFMGLGAFGILTVQRERKAIETYEDLNGFGKEAPVLALLMTLFMFSMIGIPLTAGFIGKFQLFSVALESGWIWLTLVAIVNSIISVFYYLKVVVHMYMKKTETTITIFLPKFALLGLAGCAFFILYLGVFPNILIQLTILSVPTVF